MVFFPTCEWGQDIENFFHIISYHFLCLLVEVIQPFF